MVTKDRKGKKMSRNSDYRRVYNHRKGSVHIKPSHEGELHRELGVKEGHKIGASRLHSALREAKKEGDVKRERQIVFAENFGHKK